LTVVQSFGKHCSCYLQDEYELDGLLWQPHAEQEVSGALDETELIGGAVQQPAIQ
jgi:hypothetical protein